MSRLPQDLVTVAPPRGAGSEYYHSVQITRVRRTNFSRRPATWIRTRRAKWRGADEVSEFFSGTRAVSPRARLPQEALGLNEDNAVMFLRQDEAGKQLGEASRSSDVNKGL
ncbi:hypothetical protein GN956_G8353 [Arapaima gigas]